MSVSVTVQVKMNRLPAMSRAVRPKANAAIHKAGFSYESKVKVRAKVDTGAMRAGVNTINGDLSSRVISPAMQSGFLDAGTRYIPADRWFSGPADEVGTELEADLAGVFR